MGMNENRTGMRRKGMKQKSEKKEKDGSGMIIQKTGGKWIELKTEEEWI